MIGALLRAFLKGVLVLVLLACGLAGYYLYRAGKLPVLQEAIEDATVVGSVKAALSLHRDLSHRAIDVAFDRGRVVLSGAVATQTEKKEAAELAGSVDGVTEVDNRLEIEPELAAKPGSGSASDERSLGEKLDDVALLAKVRAALRLDREIRSLDVDVSVRSGMVRLSGRVPSERLREKVRDRVAGVGGVAGLEDDLEVSGTHGSKGRSPDASGPGGEPERVQ